MTDQEILDRRGGVLEAMERLRERYEHVAIEIPPGRPQIEHSAWTAGWTPRGRRPPLRDRRRWPGWGSRRAHRRARTLVGGVRPSAHHLCRVGDTGGPRAGRRGPPRPPH